MAMCGICGIIDFQGDSTPDIRETVSSMTSRLIHRGPDAQGIWDSHGVAMGHRRLKVIDLVGSQQPMEDPTGRFVMVYNGEIYNYLELQSELQSRGVRFRSKGDTEVLLNAFIAFGPEFLKKLNGMFAFAIWDRREKTLFAARDRLGVKPFFYGINKSHFFAF